MGQSQSIYDKQGNFRPYDHPYSFYQQIKQFPYRFHLYYSKYNRLALYAVLLMALPAAYVQFAMRSATSKKNFALRRHHNYSETHFPKPQPLFHDSEIKEIREEEEKAAAAVHHKKKK